MPRSDSPPPPSPDALRALVETFLRCPTQDQLDAVQTALRAHQTAWIRARAGRDAPAAAAGGAEAAPASVPKPRFRIPDGERAVLERMADGWQPTTAEVGRWAWFEDRELVRLEPNPAGRGPEVLCLTPAGWSAIGRPAPEGTA